jgi:cytochrome c oxidase subunit 2
MPITVFAVTPEEYEAWLAGEAQEFASRATCARRVSSNSQPPNDA